MEEFLSLTIASAPDERESDFASRLTLFWTRMLRQYPDDFEKVYAEASAFERSGNQVTRQYLIEESVQNLLVAELRAAGLEFREIDPDDTYSKYEAVAPEWMQIEH